MTSTIGFYVLDFLGNSNVLFLVHFECMYQQMKLFGCIQVTNRCRINFCKFKHPHINLWVFGVHSNGQQTYIYSCKLKHPHKWSSWRAFNWSIDVGSYYKVNASYVYNVDKILSQSNKFQHLSTFDAWQWIFRRYFLMKGSLKIWVPKKGIKLQHFLGLLFKITITWKKNLLSKIE
jgi:hypothetical protein